jgi:dTDP-4-amino-4,6-dideoxygalactose transaminase
MIPLVAPTITNHDRLELGRLVHTDILHTEHTVTQFEHDFATYAGARGAVAVCSGTAALAIAVELLDLQHVDIPTYTCVALRNATLHCNTTLLDSTWSTPLAMMTVEDTSNHLIVPHMFGNPTRIGPSGRRTAPNAHTIEDWTLSLGGVPGLGEGHLGVCSTQQTKMISTGRGGVLFSDDESLLEAARELANYETHHKPAWSVRMSSLQAALGISQLQQLDGFIDRRKDIAAYYGNRFRHAGIPCPDLECDSVFYRYIVETKDPAGAVLELAGHGIQAGRGVNPPLHRLEGHPDELYPGATRCFNTLLSVPCHPSLTDKQTKHIADHVINACAT